MVHYLFVICLLLYIHHVVADQMVNEEIIEIQMFWREPFIFAFLIFYLKLLKYIKITVRIGAEKRLFIGASSYNYTRWIRIRTASLLTPSTNLHQVQRTENTQTYSSHAWIIIIIIKLCSLSQCFGG